MQQIMQPRVIKIKGSDKTYEISLKPLERGLGVTVGETITRLMYDTLVGCQLSKITIKLDQQNVLDVSTRLPTQETIEEIILNLQEVIFESSAPPGQYTLTLGTPPEATVVTAAAIRLEAEMQVLNPEKVLYHYIGDPQTILEIQLVVIKAAGHSIHPHAHDGVSFHLDACFSPVLNCTYKILDTRVDESTDFNELLLCVTLRNSRPIQPLFHEVLDQLQSQIQYFLAVDADTATAKMATKKLPLDTQISALQLSGRVLSCLQRHGIHTLHDLTTKDKQFLQQLANFGTKSLLELEAQLQLAGYLLA